MQHSVGSSPVLYLSLFALTTTNVAEFAAPATPVLLILILRAVIDRKAESVEGLAAHLTKYHLKDKMPPRVELYFPIHFP